MESPYRKGKRPSALRNNRQQVVKEIEIFDDKRTVLGDGVAPLTGGGGIFKSAAVAVLRQERKLMTTGDITRVALERGLIKCQGKTPEATMASALYTDVKRKHDKSVFTRPQEGLFGLREWIDEGYFPEGWESIADGLGLAPFKKRTTTSISKSRMLPGRFSKGRASSAWRGASEEYDEDYDDEGGEDEGDEYDDMDEGEEGDTGEDELEEGEDMEPEPEPVPVPSPKQQSSARRGRAPSSTRSHSRRESRERGHEFDDLESPLHVLGDAALNDSLNESIGHTGGKRKRPSYIQMPDHRHEDTKIITPKSPFEDSLAALHEIATSPNPYAPNGIIDLTTRENKRKPKLVVDVHQDHENLATSMAMPALTTPSSLLHGLDMTGPDSTGRVLLTASPLATASRGMNLGKTGQILLNIPSLTSPAGSLAGFIDTPTLLSMPLPDSLPTTPDIFNAAFAAGHSGLALLSPRGLLSGATPRQGVLASMVKQHRASEGGQATGQQQPGPLLHVNGAGQPSSAMAPPNSLANGSKPFASTSGRVTDAASAEAELAEVSKMQGVVERLEGKLGRDHPQVGKAWLALARMYQHIGLTATTGMVRAANALECAWTAATSSADTYSASLHSNDSFQYLRCRMNTLLSQGLNQPSAVGGSQGQMAHQSLRDANAASQGKLHDSALRNTFSAPAGSLNGTVRSQAHTSTTGRSEVNCTLPPPQPLQLNLSDPCVPSMASGSTQLPPLPRHGLVLHLGSPPARKDGLQLQAAS